MFLVQVGLRSNLFRKSHGFSLIVVGVRLLLIEAAVSGSRWRCQPFVLKDVGGGEALAGVGFQDVFY